MEILRAPQKVCSKNSASKIPEYHSVHPLSLSLSLLEFPQWLRVLLEIVEIVWPKVARKGWPSSLGLTHTAHTASELKIPAGNLSGKCVCGKCVDRTDPSTLQLYTPPAVAPFVALSLYATTPPREI